MSIDISFNGYSFKELGLLIKSYPYDMLAMRRFKQETLSRYDGTIYTDEETYDSYDISIECIVRDNFTVENLRRDRKSVV